MKPSKKEIEQFVVSLAKWGKTQSEGEQKILHYILLCAVQRMQGLETSHSVDLNAALVEKLTNVKWESEGVEELLSSYKVALIE